MKILLLVGTLLLATPVKAQIPAGLPTRDGMPTLAPVLEKVTPAVVNIAVLQRSPEEQNPMLRDPFFRRFFGAPQQTQPQIAAGSGVIVDARAGYVMTNAHVVKDAREIQVTLKENFPPISLPKREYMERARAIWEELGLPKLKPESPWFGYSLGEWSEDLDRGAAAAVRGDYFEYGKALIARRRKDVPMNTEVRDLRPAAEGNESDE